MKGKIEMKANNEGGNKVLTSQELLTVKSQNRGKKIVKSLLKSEIEPQRERKVFETYKNAESPLIHQLQNFLPKFKTSTIDIASKPDDERKKFDIENFEDDDGDDGDDEDDDDSSTVSDVDNRNKVIEMNLFFGRLNEDSSSSEEDSSSDGEDEREIVKEFHPHSLQIVKKGKKEKQKLPQKLISEVATCDSINNPCKENR